MRQVLREKIILMRTCVTRLLNVLESKGLANILDLTANIYDHGVSRKKTKGFEVHILNTENLSQTICSKVGIKGSRA